MRLQTGGLVPGRGTLIAYTSPDLDLRDERNVHRRKNDNSPQPDARPAGREIPFAPSQATLSSLSFGSPTQLFPSQSAGASVRIRIL